MNKLEQQRFHVIWAGLIGIGCLQLLFRLTHINALLFVGSEFISLLVLDLLFAAYLSIWPAYLQIENQVQDLRRKTIMSLLQTTGLFLLILHLVYIGMALVRGSRLWPLEFCILAITLIWFAFKAIPQLRRLPCRLRPYAWRILATISAIFFILGSHLFYWGYPSINNFGLHVKAFEHVVKIVEQEKIQLDPLRRRSEHEEQKFRVNLPRRHQYLSPCGTVLTQEISGAKTLAFCQFGTSDGESSILYRSDNQDISITPDEHQRLQQASPDSLDPWYLSRTKLQDHWFWVEAWS